MVGSILLHFQFRLQFLHFHLHFYQFPLVTSLLNSESELNITVKWGGSNWTNNSISLSSSPFSFSAFSLNRSASEACDEVCNQGWLHEPEWIPPTCISFLVLSTSFLLNSSNSVCIRLRFNSDSMRREEEVESFDWRSVIWNKYLKREQWLRSMTNHRVTQQNEQRDQRSLGGTTVIIPG